MFVWSLNLFKWLLKSTNFLSALIPPTLKRLLWYSIAPPVTETDLKEVELHLRITQYWKICRMIGKSHVKVNTVMSIYWQSFPWVLWFFPASVLWSWAIEENYLTLHCIVWDVSIFTISGTNLNPTEAMLDLYQLEIPIFVCWQTYTSKLLTV